jgi:hypothetical protein
VNYTVTQEELQARQKAAAEFICDGEYRDLLEPMSEVIGALFRTGGDEQQEINQIFARLSVETRDRVAARCFSMLPQIWEMMNMVGQQKDKLRREVRARMLERWWARWRRRRRWRASLRTRRRTSLRTSLRSSLRTSLRTPRKATEEGNAREWKSRDLLDAEPGFLRESFVVQTSSLDSGA